MYEFSKVTQGSSYGPGRRYASPGWRMVFIALVLALLLGSTGRISPVRAAQGGESVFFSMVVAGKPKTTLCAGQTTTYSVKVEFESRGMPTPVPGPLGKLAVVNIKVEASSKDPGVGDFTNYNSTTNVAAGDDLTGLAVASFPFTAKKTGTTILYFEGLVQGEYVSANLPVKVIVCKFKVTSIGQWHARGGGAHIFIAATSNDAEVKAAEAQSPFTGSTSVNWAGSVDRVLDCAGTITIGSSQVSWTGAMDEGGQLTLNGDYQTAAGSMDAECVSNTGESTSGSMPVDLTPDPVQLTVGSSGGSSRQAQTLQGPEAIPGSVTIIVFPEEDTAAAFLPGYEELRIGIRSLWWSMLSDDFSPPHGARLGLR